MPASCQVLMRLGGGPSCATASARQSKTAIRMPLGKGWQLLGRSKSRRCPPLRTLSAKAEMSSKPDLLQWPPATPNQ